MMFLEVNNNKTYGEDYLPEEICRELIRIDAIQHVYIVLPERTAICIEYKNRRGRNCNIYEDFENPGHCAVRFNEITRLLTKGE